VPFDARAAPIELCAHAGAEIRLGLGVRIEGGASLEAASHIEIGAGAKLGSFCKILRGGWLWTGDLASRDARRFLFPRPTGEGDFKVGGHRVGPAEIEHALERHPEVAEAAVVAVKSQLVAEAAAAFVVRRKGGGVGEAELRRFCRELLPAYKVPATITFVEKLPRNAAGKLLRGQIAAFRSGEEGP